VAHALAIESLLLVIAAVVAAATTVHPGNASAYALIVLTGFAAESRLAGGSGKGSVRRLSAVLAMLVGAIAGALLLRASVCAPLGLSAVLAIATWLVYVPAAVRLGSSPQ